MKVKNEIYLTFYSIYISDIFKFVNQNNNVIKRKTRFNIIVIYYLNATQSEFFDSFNNSILHITVICKFNK